jgi:AcrR family transcriptional regulator
VAAETGSLRQTRERELVLATRAIFDRRGVLHAPVEEIAQAVGIARGLVYRQFSSKEELVVLTVTDYLAELEPILAAARSGAPGPSAQLRDTIAAYAEFCQRYPVFLDICLSLLHRPARELRETLSDSVWLRLGRSMASCIEHLIEVLRAGAADGTFDVEDPEFLASILWTQSLGAMHLARSGVGVSQVAPGVPRLFTIEAERVVQSCVASALATVGARPAPSIRTTTVGE